MVPAVSMAVSGLSSASSSVNDRAVRIIRATAAEPLPAPEKLGDAKTSVDNDLVNDIVGLGLDKTSFKANMAVLRTAREMEERLLDIIA